MAKSKNSKPRRADETTLTKAALGYLQRYATSKQNLRRVLYQRVERAVQAYGTDRREGRALVDQILDRCEANGLIDDGRYAAAAVEAWHGRGESLRSIRARLAQKGVASPIIEEVLAAFAEDHADPDLAAAMALARRRRLGPYRPEERREQFYEKDLGVLARAGFHFAMARRILDAEDVEALEALLE